MLLLILTSMLTLALNIKPVEGWTGTAYIRADGQVDPPDAPISTLDYVTYALTDNITSSDDGIVVERDNIVVDGNGYTLQGSRIRRGFVLSEINNVTIKNTNVNGFIPGIWLNDSSNNEIFGCNITANKGNGIELMHSCSNNTVFENNITANNLAGIEVYFSSNNVIYGNNIRNNEMEGIEIWRSSNNLVSRNSITDNMVGANLYNSSDNRFYHNSFINNTGWQAYSYGSTNVWDDDYPSGGNYWSDYSDKYPSVKDRYQGKNQDAHGSDGIWDSPYAIGYALVATDQDRYPLVNPWDNIPPVANAGPDQAVNEDTLLTFNGSASSDNVAITAYTWTFADVTIKTLTGEKPAYTFNTPSVYTITLNVTDKAGNWATDTITVTVLPGEAPPPPFGAFTVWIVGAAVGMIAIAAVAAVLLRRRKKKPSAH